LQRQQVKQMLDGWEKTSPGRRQVMFRALTNARPSHLLDPALFDFQGLVRHSPNDDKAVDIPDLR
jgi:tRNA 2-thiocytidine biosynthesis protein TtcA